MKQIVAYWTQHPLAKKRLLTVFMKFLWWQLICRLKKTVIVSFASKSKLAVTRGMTGATGNIYCGLHEFEDMGFILHALRKSDHFLDIGANIGSYSILAASEIGATVDCFEPVPSTFRFLTQNIQINHLESNCAAHNQGIGDSNTTLQFTDDRDTVNHVIPHGSNRKGIEVPVQRLDDLQLPEKNLLAKIDVEGFERYVIEGGMNTLKKPNFLALIIELNGSGKRYGNEDLEIHKQLLHLGFLAHTYNPLTRQLIALNEPGPHNTIYMKEESIPFLVKRTMHAEKISILGISF